MNFVYLLVEGCYNYGSNYNGLPKLNYSICSLKKNYDNINNIYLYYGYDELDMDKLDKINSYCKNNNIILIDFGNLKHKFKSERQSSNPYQLSILIEKIYLLKNHQIEEDICYVDLDTEFTENIKNYKFDLLNPIFHDKEYKLFTARNLSNFFNILSNKNVNENTFMFNSGIIYIPKNMRRQIAQESIDFVIEISKYRDNLRICNRLDEQMALSIYVQKYYNNINILNKEVNHYWSSVVEKDYWV